LDGAIFIALRRRVDGHLHPIGVVEVQEYELNKFGPSRIHSIDPHKVWRRHDPEMFARIAPLDGKHFQSLGAAAQTLYQTYHPTGASTPYLHSFECFVVGLPGDEAERERRLLGQHKEFTQWYGERLEMRSSPGLALRPVTILQDDDGTPGGEWHPVGVLRPFVPKAMPAAEARRALDEMERKVRRRRQPATATHAPAAPAPRAHDLLAQGTFEPKPSANQRRAPKRPGEPPEDGQSKEASGRKRVKADGIKEGALVYIEEGYPAGEHVRHPHILTEYVFERAEGNASRLQGEKHGVLRSLVDDSQRQIPRTAIRPFSFYFGRRAEQHLCDRCAECRGMLRAIDVRRAGCRPTMSRAAALKQCAHGARVLAPEGWCEAGEPGDDRPREEVMAQYRFSES